MSGIQEQAKKLLRGLQSLKSDKAAMSSLRKALSESLAYKAWPYLVRWCDLENLRMRTITGYVAAFYATHPEHTDNKNFGECLRELAIQRKGAFETIEECVKKNERYLKRLIGTRNSLGLCSRVAFFMRMMKGHGIKIDYESLYKDIVYWNENTKVRWAKGYYIEEEVKNVSDSNIG